ncbi:PILR alpha-associated neural protein [Festucalex cinctus]
MERCSIAPVARLGALVSLVLVALVTQPSGCHRDDEGEERADAPAVQLSVGARATPTPLWAVVWGPTQPLEEEEEQEETYRLLSGQGTEERLRQSSSDAAVTKDWLYPDASTRPEKEEGGGGGGGGVPGVVGASGRRGRGGGGGRAGGRWMKQGEIHRRQPPLIQRPVEDVWKTPTPRDFLHIQFHVQLPSLISSFVLGAIRHGHALRRIVCVCVCVTVDPQFYVTVTISTLLILTAIIITAKLCYDRSCARHPPPLSRGVAPPLSRALPCSLASEESRQTLHSASSSFADRERIPVVNL